MENKYDVEGYRKFLSARYEEYTARTYLRPIQMAANANVSLEDLCKYTPSQLAVLVQKTSRGSRTSASKKYRSGVLTYLQYLRIIGAEQ